MTPDRVLWAVSISDLNAAAGISKPRKLFHPPAFVMKWTSSPYDVNRSGNRFIFVCEPHSEQPQLVLVTNWQQ